MSTHKTQLTFEENCRKFQEWHEMAEIGLRLDEWLRETKKYGDIRRPNVYFVGSPRNFHLTVEGRAHGRHFRKTFHGAVGGGALDKLKQSWDAVGWNVQ